MLAGLSSVQAQSVTDRLTQALRVLEADPQLRHGLVGFCVVDAATGKQLYGRNEQVGLAPASTQKLFTAAAALEQLGPTFRYKTVIGYDGRLENGLLQGNLHILAYGDPTLGSNRWKETGRNYVLQQICDLLREKNIRRIEGSLYINDTAFSIQPLPGGWIWDDIGNYYGAGCWGLNWNENQYTLLLKTGNAEGAPTQISGTDPALAATDLVNEIRTGKKGSGDNGYIYLSPYSPRGFTQGTVPPGAAFSIAGALPHPALLFANELEGALTAAGIPIAGRPLFYIDKTPAESWPAMQQVLGELSSPALSAITYWFLRKSINLYGESLLRTMAYTKKGLGENNAGIEIVKSFWTEQGIDAGAMQLMDGSGLSPMNRVTADALVRVLQYARTRPWQDAFYQALPEYNGMKMKSGSFGGARAYAGYHTSRAGKQYSFAIIVNNYDGSAGEVVKKMYRVLDVLK